MTMSTPTLREAARVLAEATLRDTVQIYTVGAPVTVGFEVQRPLTAIGEPVASLVQSTTLLNAVESQTQTTFSVKVHAGTPLSPGQVVRVVACELEPELVGKVLLLDKISLNGAAMIRKAVASDFEAVNQEGKVTIP